MVAQLQRRLAPSARITESDKIRGRSGVIRTLDVAIRQEIGTYEVLIAIDCKEHGRAVGVGYVSKLLGQVEDVGARLGVVVSNTGFTKGAREVARDRRVVLQTLRTAEQTDWQALVGPSAWTSIVGFKSSSESATALLRDGGRVGLSFNTAVLDAQGQSVESIADVFFVHWKQLGPERRLGPARLTIQAAPRQVFVRREVDLAEVDQFEIVATIGALRWLVPLALGEGHVLTSDSGQLEHARMASASFEWQKIMATQAPDVVSPDDFVRMVQGGELADLTGAKRFLRLDVAVSPKQDPSSRL